MPLRSGLTINNPIGAGFFGQVFLGSDQVHGPIAVKALRRKPGEPELDWQNRRAVLLQEGQRLAQAKHQNVVEVYYIVEDDTDDTILIAMELCAGGSLQTAFDVGPLTLRQVRDYASQVSLGLEALHARGMLHRDIKPSNILIDANGKAKIGDFGLVTDDLILGYGSINGYSDHVAYEVYQGTGTSVRSDIWAFGMTIYRLLHGSYWYKLSPPPQLIIENGGFANKLRWLPHTPGSWRRFIRKCMADNPLARYQSMQQVNTALAGLPIMPDWTCSVDATGGRWERIESSRKHVVTWTQHNPRTHDWAAWSEPTGEGRKRSKGGATQLNNKLCMQSLTTALK